MKIYMDLCCLNRPFDDQSQARIALESQAIVLIIERIDHGEHTLCNSAALVVENSLSPRTQVRLEIDVLLERADHWIPHDRAIDVRAAELRKMGFKEFDAYHIAAAESASCDRLVTCDDKFLKTARRNTAKIEVTVTDPVRLVSDVDF
jgi:predicted nucleic acid-binding protein